MHNLRRLAVATAALLLAVVALGFRLPTLGSLSNDHYLYMAWAQQLLSGDLPGRDFVDPGMPLAYSLSALVQYLWPGPFSEAVLSIAMLAIAAAVTCLVVTDVSGSLLGGIGAALFQIALQPRLYSYPKILVPVVALWLLYRYIQNPSRLWMITMAIWVVVGALLRYDLGLYAMAGLLLGVFLSHWGEPRRMMIATGSFLLFLAVALLPYAAFVQIREGIPTHLHDTVEYTRNEEHALDFPWPVFRTLRPDAPEDIAPGDSATFLFYAAYVLAVLPLVLLAATYKRQTRQTVAVAIAVCAMLAAYLIVVLRYPIHTRIQDLAGVMTLAGGWTVVALLRTARQSIAAGGVLRIGGATVSALLALVLTIGSGVSVWTLGKVDEQFRETRVTDGLDKMQERVAFIRESGTIWPWDRFWPAGPLPDAVRYLNECTHPEDRVLLTWSAPEFYYFSRRAFAAGHAIPLPPRAYIGTSDQQLMVKRASRRRVPIVLINETRQNEFAAAYPMLDEYLHQNYAPSGQFELRGGSTITIGIRKDLAPTASFGDTGWPCPAPQPAAKGLKSQR